MKGFSFVRVHVLNLRIITLYVLAGVIHCSPRKIAFCSNSATLVL